MKNKTKKEGRKDGVYVNRKLRIFIIYRIHENRRHVACSI